MTMDYRYYPERISDDDVDDDEISSCQSSEIDGGISDVDQLAGSELRGHSANARVVMTNDSGRGDALFSSSSAELCVGADTYDEQADFVRSIICRDGALNASLDLSNAGSNMNSQSEQNRNEMAEMIQHERNRRLGVRPNVEPTNYNATISSAAPFPERVFGNFRGWFGSGGGTARTAKENGKQSSLSHHASSSTHSTREYKQDEQLRAKPQQLQNISHDDNSSLSNPSEESSSDDDSSASSSISLYLHDDANFTPQERARERALRYLSNSCVDSGRKFKTASYVWGLERLDLTRKRDRLAKELEIVESEMNKDHRLANHAVEGEPIPQMAETLVRELPRIQGADAGAGIELVNSCFMTWEEYADAMNADSTSYPSAWDNKGAVDLYVDSLQRRLRESVDRTRSLEKRLVVLENAGDDIVSSLCEDLAEITKHSYKTEARYIKKGKELQRKRRREELRHRIKIRQAQHRVHKLEAQLMAVSGNTRINECTLNHADLHEGSDISTDDSTITGIDDDDNEVLLEKNLSTLRLKYEQEKQNHKSELESIRRQCEQLKFHLSVARLVMEGDDNLYEYVVLLERCDTRLRRERKDGVGDVFSNRGQSEVGDLIPPPPSRITRARAKLLKVTHLETIYEQRLVASKAFTDATIKALDQELVERETFSQEMEVRCLNELVVMDTEIKDAHNGAIEKLAVLEKEAHELQDAISACIIQNPTADLSLLGCNDDRNSFLDPLLRKGDELLNRKSFSGPTADIVSTRLYSETGGAAFVSDEPCFSLNDRGHGEEEEKHVIIPNDNTNSNDSLTLDTGSQLMMAEEGFVESHSAQTHHVGGNGVGRKVLSIKEREWLPQHNIFTSRHESLKISEQLSEIKMHQNLIWIKAPGTVGMKTPSPPSQMVTYCDETTLPNKAALKQLGSELKCTLASYQKSYHSSTSSDRIEHLDTMNDLVVQIAKSFGPNVGFENTIGVSELTSWSFKKTRKPPLDKESRDQTRIQEKTKRRNRNVTRRAFGQ